MRLRVGERGDLVRDLQYKLKDFGYYPGPIDGVFSQNTKWAVFRFQKDRNIKTDGTVKSMTLNALGLNPELQEPKFKRETRKAKGLKRINKR